MSGDEQVITVELFDRVSSRPPSNCALIDRPIEHVVTIKGYRPRTLRLVVRGASVIAENNFQSRPYIIERRFQVP
jgi:hypothetical protein